ncbi:transcriptional regulator [Algoriphagus sp. SE2]|uniref:transcriptional regulator n=1 Tax=Algoriphagus sp. SE2 TaxID=3141536 RepID=UPI0031CCE99B
MKILIKSLLLLFLSSTAWSQIKFIERFEVASELYEPNFEMARVDDGIVAFRTVPEKGLNFRRKIQYFKTDFNLSPSKVIEFPVKEGFDIIGFDVDEGFLFLLMQKGYASNSDKYIFKINLDSDQGIEFDANNLLDMELVEFLVLDEKALFMGIAERNPVLQILDLNQSSVITVQGIYNPDTQVLQLRKVPELKEMELVMSREVKNRSKEILVNTYDLNGNLMREVRVDRFGDADQEIMDGLLLPMSNYQQAMIGSFGYERRNTYLGMYIMDINEFGEYSFKIYTLEDFPNFYNYLDEKEKIKKDEAVVKDLEKDKIPTLRNVYSIRDVYTTDDSYVIYFDHYNMTNSRGNTRPGTYSPSSHYRYDRLNRLGYTPYFSDPFYQNVFPNGSSYQVNTEFHYVSAHFAKIGKEGNVIWDNSSTYDDFTTSYTEPFGEMAVVGEDVYHMYVEDLNIVLSFFRNGEKVFDNQYFQLELVEENERIKDTDPESLRLVHWYGRYFLLSGNQRVRYQDESGKEQVREVFFVTKILVDGDLYQPEESLD